ncbi:MAG: GNAT family N-acetyltransferase [Paludibacteraceae bacterium]|nr:GNAT family N-acetyltransferase [Paludibacteraceae bacterium]
MNISDFSFYKLSGNTAIKQFNCNDKDLNDFIYDDAKNYLTELMAVTYIIESKRNDQTAAYFSLLNDKITYNQEEKNFWNKINRSISNNKRRKHYPAVKIGRLAIDHNYTGQGLGTKIIKLIISMFTQGNRTGCRFLTVDAYHNAIPFYQACGFAFFSNKDAGDATRLMYYDLKRFSL